MTSDTQDLVAFRLTGRHPDKNGESATIQEAQGETMSKLVPALFAGYSDLTSLRYDFPLVLARSSGSSDSVQSLTDVMNNIIGALAPEGSAGEFERKQLLELERQIRTYVADGAKGSLGKFWKKAQADLIRATEQKEKKALKSCLDQGFNLLEVGGDVIDCNEQTSAKVLEHVWAAEVGEKALRFQRRVGALILRLERILEADFEISGEAQAPETLKRALGDALASSFDFKALSDLLKGSDTHDALPQTRTGRIESALKALKTQRFFATGFLDTDERAHEHGGEKSSEPVHKFVFTSCARAHDAFLDRLPEMVELVKAIAIAELEIVNGYKPDFHDDFFANYDQTSLMPEDLDLFPPCLAICRGQPWSTTEKGRIIETLSSGLPIKIMVQTDDIVPVASVGSGPFSRGLSGVQFAGLAIGLGSAFVLQTSASNLYQLRSELKTGVGSRGPALFSLFSGVGEKAKDETSKKANVAGTYLNAASAMEARTFPAFAFDPEAGDTLASRFSLLNNPAAQGDWTSYSLNGEDDDLQRVILEFPFTPVDFMAADERYRSHFVKVARSGWVDEMIPAGDYLALSPLERSDKIPYVLMVNEEGEASRYVVDDTVTRAAERIREIWRGLQELGGINNSHAKIRVDAEREVWEAQKEKELEALHGELESVTAAAAQSSTPGAPVAAGSAPAVADATSSTAEAATDVAESPTPEEAAPEPEVQSDDLWIETARCTTCNECTDLNDQIFSYNEDMQAVVLDGECGPYKDIIEAAENCQVAIIHPGRPKNPNEPGLEDLIKRAELFS